MPTAILSRRRRRCFFVRGALLREPPRPEPPPPRDPPVRERAVGCPADDRRRHRSAGLPSATPSSAHGRRRPACGRRRRRRHRPCRARPLRCCWSRAGGGRRTDPARGATGEVSSWDGTQQFPSLTVSATSRCGDGDDPCRSVASSGMGAGEDARLRGLCRNSCDGRVRRGDGTGGAGRPATRWPPGAGSGGAGALVRARHLGRTRSPDGSSRSRGTPRRSTRRTPAARRPCARAPPPSSPGRPSHRGARRRRSSPA